jgi:CDP-diacylglycerol--glycerol-3-phosphate 3-phosphatidyltransferase
VSDGFGPSALVTPANGVTVGRMLASPVLILVVAEVGISWVAIACWVVLTASDGIDGWLARRQGTTTSGAFLDPLADKVLVLGALAAIAARGWVPWAPVAIIAGRELVISVYRSRVARHGKSVPARPLGKAKTVVQDLAVGVVLLPVTGLHALWLGRDLLWVAVALAVLSGAQYLLDSRRHRWPVAAVPATSRSVPGMPPANGPSPVAGARLES